MNDRSTFETELASVFAAYADRAPVEVDPISMTASVARGRTRRPWALLDRRVSLLLIGVVLVLLALGAALAGAYLLRTHPSISKGGLMLIDQANRPDTGHLTTSEHVFTLDAATGERQPIVDWVTRYGYGFMSMAWSPDQTNALLHDAGGGVKGIVDVATHHLNPIQLRPGDTSLTMTERSAWAPGSDRVVSIVSNDTTNTEREILISDLSGREVGRLPMPSGWSASQATWSPDGTSLILTGCLPDCVDGAIDEDLLLVPIDGSPMRVLLEPRRSYGPAILSPDGSTIAFESSAGIQTLDLVTGRRTIVTSGNDLQPSWSPDGTMLTFGRRDGVMVDDLDVWIVRADGGTPHLLVTDAVSDW
jgi:hypothetical protein